MAVIRLIDKQGEFVVEEAVPHDKTSLKPLPHVINREDKVYRFYTYQGNGVVAIYKESDS